MKDTKVLTAERVLETALDADRRFDPDLVGRTRAVLDDQAIALVHNFPADPDNFVELVRHFGEPMENYSAYGDMHKDEPHPVLNRVRYRAPETRQTASVHYVDGLLAMHSARAWTDPRPSYFSMYMVEAGWKELPEGQRGESLFVRWHDLLHNERDNAEFAASLHVLKERPVEFRSKNVNEATSKLPLVYELPDAADEFDFGVRMKQDLLDVLRAEASDVDYVAAAEALVAASARETNQIRFEMRSGDVVIVDNHRVSHGRTGMVGEAEIDGRREFNPREIWSTTLR